MRPVSPSNYRPTALQGYGYRPSGTVRLQPFWRRNDIEEAMNAATAVGDDNIQRQTTGQINRETWIHGSSEERFNWPMRGFDTGQPNGCDTY